MYYYHPTMSLFYHRTAFSPLYLPTLPSISEGAWCKGAGGYRSLPFHTSIQGRGAGGFFKWRRGVGGQDNPPCVEIPDGGVLVSLSCILSEGEGQGGQDNSPLHWNARWRGASWYRPLCLAFQCERGGKGGWDNPLVLKCQMEVC